MHALCPNITSLNDQLKCLYLFFQLPSHIDNVINKESIRDLFADKDKYKDVFNCVSYDESVMNEVLNSINNLTSSECMCGKCSNTHSISRYDIKLKLKHLKHSKNDGNDGNVGHSTDHMLYGTKMIDIQLSLLLTSMLRHPMKCFCLQ